MCTLLERFDEHDGKYIQYSKKYTLGRVFEAQQTKRFTQQKGILVTV